MKIACKYIGGVGRGASEMYCQMHVSIHLTQGHNWTIKSVYLAHISWKFRDLCYIQ